MRYRSRHCRRVGICNLDEDYLGEFSNGYGSGEGQLIWPVAMAMDSQDSMYVTDEQNHRVTVYDSSGVFLRQWGGAGSGDGEVQGPSGIAIDSKDNVYVVDQGNSRIHKFTTDGRHLLQWGGPGGGPGQFNLPWAWESTRKTMSTWPTGVTTASRSSPRTVRS